LPKNPLDLETSTLKAMLHEAIFLATCKKKFTCNTPFCNCNCYVVSCKKSRTTLYFSQCCETSCLRVTSPQQLATRFCQKLWANQSSSFTRCRRLSASAILFAIVCVASYEKSCTRLTPLCNLKGFLFVIVSLQVARKIA